MIFQAISTTPALFATPSPFAMPFPRKKILENNYHVFQSFNNCGPASLSMALSYFGIQKSQEELGQSLRPYQNPQGDNDDKSVTFEEMAKEAEKLGFTTYHRPNGNITLLIQFIAADIPVLTRTWLDIDEDIGHYRVVKGYDEEKKQLLQDDSFENKNLWFSYDDFTIMWEKFDYEYLVLVPKDKEEIARKILGKNVDKQYAWKQAVKTNELALKKNPHDIYTLFNLSIAYYHTKQYKKAAEAFEKVETSLPFRTLWYQIEPLLAYYELGNDEKVLSLTESILTNHNRAYSEAYILRGNVYKRQGNKEAAKQEYEKAVFYNSNLNAASSDLASL
jgi:tetratricopeptide (TPR) repeat protein